jgi:hypothetical protein
MKMILVHDGKVLDHINDPEVVEPPEQINFLYYCDHCLLIHNGQFERIGIHDDGPTYELKRIKK